MRAFGHVEVGAKHAENLAVRVAQRHLARQQRDDTAVRGGLRLVDKKLAAAALDYFAVVGPVLFRLFAPAQLVIVFADDLVWA